MLRRKLTSAIGTGIKSRGMVRKSGVDRCGPTGNAAGGEIMKLSHLCAGLAALAAAVASFGTAPVQAQDKKPYVIYLSNNFVGNDWRQQMERVAEVSVKKGPLAGRVDLKIENVENTVQAQINSLNNIIRQKPDAILVDA